MKVGTYCRQRVHKSRARGRLPTSRYQSQSAGLPQRSWACRRHGRTHHAESGHAGKVGRARVAVGLHYTCATLFRQPNRQARTRATWRTRRDATLSTLRRRRSGRLVPCAGRATGAGSAFCSGRGCGHRRTQVVVSALVVRSWVKMTNWRQGSQVDSRLCMVGGVCGSSTHSASKDSSSRQGCESVQERKRGESASEREAERGGASCRRQRTRT